MPIVLGIESTAHTFGIGIVKNGKILANVKKTYTTEKGGIIPVESANHHKQNEEIVYNEALDKSGINENEIQGIAISQGPGLSPCLLVGMNFAKRLSEKLNKPIVPVNHCIAHLEIGKVTGAKDPVMLYTSGANTQIIAYSSGKYRIFGETLDIGVGNFLDNFARHLGIGFPGGPRIEELARKGRNYIELPYKLKGMDISLSGILTNLKQKVETINLHSPSARDIDGSKLALPSFSLNENVNVLNSLSGKSLVKFKEEIRNNINQRASSGERVNYTKEDLCFSTQETVFAMLVETAERAMAHTGKKELLLGGGVGCNSRLQEMCRIMCEERNAKFFVPSRDLLVDNGAMIAFLGEIIFDKLSSSRRQSPAARPTEKNNKINPELIYYPGNLDELDIKPRQRTDEVEISWRY